MRPLRRADLAEVKVGIPRRPGVRDLGSFDPPGTFPMPKPQPPSNGSNLPGGELTAQQQLEALIRIMNGGKPRNATTPCGNNSPWLRNSNQTASGKPGAVQ